LEREPPVPVWFLWLAAIFVLGALSLILILASRETRTTLIQRIAWFQVPAAAVSLLSVSARGVASLLYLKTRDYRYDDFAVAANESVSLFAGVNLLAGSVWTKWAWDLRWSWNAGMTSYVWLIFIYVAYGILRRATPTDHRAAISAVVCVFSLIDVPFIYFSAYLFRARHAQPMGPGYSEIGLRGIVLLY
jgi:heme exporter protein C